MSMRTLAAAAVLVLAGSAAAAPAARDVLDTPAAISPLAPRTLLTAIVRIPGRLVAVGQRGHVVVSKDNGATWTQAPVPVSSDLTSVYFVDGRKGWAVGHDGVVLHTDDAGDTWRLQLDGRKANDLLVTAARATAERTPSSEAVKQHLADALRYRDQGADKPFLDVWFADARVGYVVGAYNYLFRTDDGGATWQPWLDRTDNPKAFNLYAIRPAAGDLYVVGESGLVLRLDTAAQRFRKVEVPYTGSFFGVADAGASVLVFGLRGTVLRSDDRGTTWTPVEAKLAGGVVASAPAPGGALLADAGGNVVASADGGRSFTRLALDRTAPVAALIALDDQRLALVGPRGVSIAQIPPR